MGFYGNITNTSRTQFQFDRIYSSRFSMDQSRYTDGIYAGRYVLVEYDETANLDTFIRGQRAGRAEDGINWYMLYNPQGTNSFSTTLKCSDVGYGDIVYVVEIQDPVNIRVQDCTFYSCITEYEEGSSEKAVFKQIATGSDMPNYTINYNIDIQKYGQGRGYDSTVWQKVYTEGKEKYVMIAELNTVVPTFDISVDAPTQSPLVPHFDTASTDVYYKLHWQPQWGFRVKSADMINGPQLDVNGRPLTDANLVPYSTDTTTYDTDEMTVWSKEEYDHEDGITYTYYWNYNNQSWDKIFDSSVHAIPAAIYYNKAGFKPEVITISNNQDKIAISPTGQSGHTYNTHTGMLGQQEVQEDIQEISMMLPSIGNSIAEMWNVVYGNYSQNNGSNIRNMDIDWDSDKGLRMVKEKEDGNGFTYDTEQVNTLAGAINSVHDLMGMIIEEPQGVSLDEAFADTADNNKIYYSEGKYYRKATDYEYTPTFVEGDVIPEGQQYTEVTKPFAIFNPGKLYYTDLAGVYKKDMNNFATLDRAYYINSDNANEDLFIPVEFETYDQEIWYRLDNNTTYSNKETTPTSEVTYYQIETQIENKSPYQKGKYIIYTDKSGNIGVPLPEIIEDDILSYISFCQDSNFNENYVYYSFTRNQDGSMDFEPISLFQITTDYFYKNPLDNTYMRCEYGKIPIIKSPETEDGEEESTVNIQYFIINIVKESSNFYHANKYYLSNDEQTEFTLYPGLIPQEGEQYYKKAKTLKIPANTGIFNYIGNIDANAFIKDKYYVKTDTYTLATYWNQSAQYYTLDELYFISSMYYYQLENGKYTIDTNSNATANRQYYSKNEGLFVYSDINGLMAIGSEWNLNVNTVPSGIVLATRRTYSRFEELKHFARTLNTIHGLIVHINNLLLSNNIYTRDRETVQGCINVLNDIINKIELITPGEFLLVDSYGRIHSTPFTTAEQYEAINYGTNNIFKKEKPEEDQWIFLNTDPTATNPLITVQHNFTPVENTITTSDKNIEEGNGNNKGKGDNINLYTPIVDNRGHVVGNNIETVTLPFGYKTISTTALNSSTNDLYTTINNQSNGANTYSATISSNEEANADNTQDKVQINPANKWIQIRVNGTNAADSNLNDDVISLAHEIHAVVTTPKSSNMNGGSVSTLGGEDNLVIPELTFDAAGHITHHHLHTHTLPYGYKHFNSNAASTIVDTDLYTNSSLSAIDNNKINANVGTAASKTQDSMSINPVNKWLQIRVTNDMIELAHEIHSVDTTERTTNLNVDNMVSNNNTDKITFQDLIFDTAGHVINNHKHTYTLPFAFKKITAFNNEVDTNANTNTNTVVANNTQADMTISGANRWIRVSCDAENDILSVGHLVRDIDKTDEISSDINNNGDTITIQDIICDDAGHIRSLKNHTYTLPYGFKTIKVNNSTDVSNADSIIAVNGQIADNTQDTLTLAASNRWISFDNNTENTIKIGHVLPTSYSETNAGHSTTQTGGEEPKFGETFLIPEIKYDEMGHINGKATHNVKIPLPSLISSQNGQDSVLTGLTLTAEDGAFAFTYNPIDVMKLKAFQIATASAKPSAGDTLGVALGKIQKEIDIEAETRATAIDDEAMLRKNADEAEKDAREKADADEVIARNSAISTAIANAIDALDVNDKAIAGQYISAVSEIDGKISVVRENLPVYEPTGSAAAVKETLIGTTEDDITQLTLNGLLNYIKELEEKITVLESAILNKSDEETPTEPETTT